MRKINLFLTMLFTIAAISSCSLIPWEDLDGTDNKELETLYKDKIYKGGNVECIQVADLYPDLNLLQTTGRNDYDPSTDSFAFGWPAGLAVKVMNDGSVSFQIDGAIDLGDGKCYKVGAVIVKGGAASNIYTYPGGATQDIGLTAPDNASETPAGLSNLTFCFVECEEEQELIIAVKSFYWDGTPEDYVKYNWAASVGEPVFEVPWCMYLGVNRYPALTSFDIHESYFPSRILGNITITENSTSYLVTVDLNEGLTLDKTYVYLGTLEGLYNTVPEGEDCPEYETWNFNDSDAKSVTVTIPR